MRIRPVICQPHGAMLGEEPAEAGYWGFVRCRGDYEAEKERVVGELKDLVSAMRGEGYDVELLPPLEVPGENHGEVYKASRELREADVNVVLPFGFPRPALEVVVALSKFTVVFDKFEPIYAGTLFAPPFVKEYRDAGFRGLLIVEGDWGRLKRVLRAIYALTKIRGAKLVVVGPVNSAFGGLKAFKRSLELFGFEPVFYTYDEFVELFNELWGDEEARRRAKEVVDEFVGEATAVKEPTEEKLMRAAVYHLALERLVEESGADWVTVNCLSELIQRTGATPCLSFALLNDRGVVATCEADPAMMAMHYLLTRLANKPAVFVDPTVNEAEGTLILAHCTSPTRVLGYGKPAVPYEVRTHHESNTGATPKPLYPKGVVTIAGLDFSLEKMLIVRGEVVGSPDLRVCRAQVEVRVSDAHRVLESWQGFHWVYVYGDYVEDLRILADLVGLQAIVVT